MRAVRSLAWVVAVAIGCAAIGCAMVGCATAPQVEPNVALAASDGAVSAAGAQGKGQDAELQASLLVRHPQKDAACPLQWPAQDVTSSVHILAAAMQPPMAAALQAVCACSVPGEVTSVYADIDFAAGAVEVRAPAAPLVDGCLRELKPTFPADASVAGSDCIDCGPKHYGVLPGSQPANAAAPASVRIRYPLQVDRSAEARR